MSLAKAFDWQQQLAALELFGVEPPEKATRVFGNNYNKLLTALKRVEVGDTKEYQNVVYASGISACSSQYTKKSLLDAGVMTPQAQKEPALWRQIGRAAVEEAQTRLVRFAHLHICLILF